MMCTATGYTSPRIDKAGQVLVTKDDTIADGHQEKEQAILAAYFPSFGCAFGSATTQNYGKWQKEWSFPIRGSQTTLNSKVCAYRVISLLDAIGKLVERTAAHLIADHRAKERKRLPRWPILVLEEEVLFFFLFIHTRM